MLLVAALRFDDSLCGLGIAGILYENQMICQVTYCTTAGRTRKGNLEKFLVESSKYGNLREAGPSGTYHGFV